MQQTLLPCFCQCLILAEGQRSPLADHKGRSEHHTLPQSHDALQFVRRVLAYLLERSLVETCDRVGVRAIANFNNESNLYLVIS